MSPSSIIALVLYILICIWTSIHYLKTKNIDPILAVFICFVLSPLLGGFILLTFPEKKIISPIQEPIPEKENFTYSLTATQQREADKIIRNILKGFSVYDQMQKVRDTYDTAKEKMNQNGATQKQLEEIEASYGELQRYVFDNIPAAKLKREINTNISTKGNASYITYIKLKIRKNKMPAWLLKFRWSIALKSTGFIIIILIATLILTNPSYENFKQFSPEYSDKWHHAEWRRVSNCGIYSIYQKDIYERRYSLEFDLVSSQKFKGFMLNFTQIK